MYCRFKSIRGSLHEVRNSDYLLYESWYFSEHFLQTLQEISNDHSQSAAKNGYEAIDFINALVQSSRDSHEHETHLHGGVGDVDIKNEENQNQHVFNGKSVFILQCKLFQSEA